MIIKQPCEFCAGIIEVSERQVRRYKKFWCPICAHINDISAISTKHNAQQTHEAKLFWYEIDQSKETTDMEISFTRPCCPWQLVDEIKEKYPGAEIKFPAGGKLEEWGPKKIILVGVDDKHEADIANIVAKHRIKKVENIEKQEPVVVKENTVTENKPQEAPNIGEALDAWFKSMLAGKFKEVETVQNKFNLTINNMMTQAEKKYAGLEQQFEGSIKDFRASVDSCLKAVKNLENKQAEQVKNLNAKNAIQDQKLAKVVECINNLAKALQAAAGVINL